MDSSEFKKGLSDAGKESSSFGKKLSSAITSATKIAGTALAGLAIKGTKDMIDFQKGITEVFSLMPGISRDAMGTMENDIRELARSMGIDLEDAVNSLYQAISAGVDPDNAVSFLEQSAKTAIAGVATLEDSVGALTTIINGYGMSAKEAGRVSDVLFSVVKNGVTSMTELGQNIGKVTPMASQLGVSIEEVGAMFAVLTKQMGAGKTAEAGTAIRSMLAELAKEGMKANESFKALGQGSFPDFIKNGGNVGQALMMMKENADSSGKSLMDLFRGIEAGNGALMLVTQNGKELSTQLQNISGDAGATETAFQLMEKSVSRQIDKLLSNFKEMGLELGESFLPILNDLIPKMADGFKSMTPTLKSLAQSFADITLTLMEYSGEIASALGFMIKFAVIAKSLMIVTTLAKGISTLTKAMMGAKTAQVALNATMLANPIGIVVGMVALLGTGILELIGYYKDLDRVEEERRQQAIKAHEEFVKQRQERKDSLKDEIKVINEAIKSLSDLKIPAPDFSTPLEQAKSLLEVEQQKLKKAEDQFRIQNNILKKRGAESDLLKEMIKNGAKQSDISGKRLLDEESRLMIVKNILTARDQILTSQKAIKDLEEETTRLAEKKLKLEQDIANTIEATRKNIALNTTEAGKIVIIGREIKDLEIAKKKLIDDARSSRVLESNEAQRLSNIETDIINKRLAIEDIVKNKLKKARQDELQAVRDIVTELNIALGIEQNRGNEAKANAEAKEKEVQALRAELAVAEQALEPLKKFFQKDFKGKITPNYAEMHREFKKLKAEGKLPPNTETLRDFQNMITAQASSAKLRRDEIIANGAKALADAKLLREQERESLDEQKSMESEIKAKREEAVALEEKIEGVKQKTLEEMRTERKDLEDTLLKLKDINVLPMFDASIVQAIATQSDNLKQLDHNVAELVGKNGSLKVDVDFDDSDITKETTQTAILETLNGYFVNQ